MVAVASTQRGIGSGALLLAVYSLGLAVPLLLLSSGTQVMLRPLSLIRRHPRSIVAVSCLFMLLVGGLLVSDRMTQMTSWINTAV